MVNQKPQGKNNNNRKLISPSLRHNILKRDGFICQLCGQKGPEVQLEVDHILPVAEGGGNNLDNLRTLCFECNRGRVIDIKHQPIMKGLNTRVKTKTDDEIDKHILDEFGIDMKNVPEYSMIFDGGHSFLFQIKSFFIKPDPWKPIRFFDDESGEWLEGQRICWTCTWREMLEDKLRYKWRIFKSGGYSTLFYIDRGYDLRR